jgi:hypothetical protein
MRTAPIALSSLIIALSACSAGSEGSNVRSSGSGGIPDPSSGGSSGLPGTGGSGTGGGVGVPLGGSGGSSDVMNGECSQVNFVSSRKPVSMLLVLDRSKSMIENNTLDGITRWDAIVPALTAAISATDASINWGLKLYPEGENTSACSPGTITSEIQIPIAPLNGMTVNERINTTEALGDGTPTGHAIQAAREYLAGLDDDTQKFILLATDGVPSCDSTPAQNSSAARTYAVQEIQAALSAGFPTFVVAMLGGSSSNIETLNNMGLAGGRPPSDPDNPLSFYHAESNDALIAALQAITSEVASCLFSFDAAPPDPTNIAVKLNGVRVEQDATDGWEYTSDQHLGIELHGSACAEVRAANQSAVDVIFGCPGRPIF